MAALGVPLDGIAGLEAHPVGSGAVLLKLLSVLKLDGERTEATHGDYRYDWKESLWS